MGAERFDRQGYLIEEQGMSYLADIDADDPLRPLQEYCRRPAVGDWRYGRPWSLPGMSAGHE
jgi:hypothetical protein